MIRITVYAQISKVYKIFVDATKPVFIVKGHLPMCISIPRMVAHVDRMAKGSYNALLHAMFD